MSDTQTDSLPPLTDSQAEFLEIIWDRGESSVTEVWNAIRRRREIARNTVQTVLSRLAEKGWLHHRAVGKTFLYSAAESREDAQKFFVGRMVDSLFAGSTEGLLMNLLENRPVGVEEAARIRAMLDEAENQAKAKANQ